MNIDFITIWLFVLLILFVVETTGRIMNRFPQHYRQIFRLMYIAGGWVTLAHLVYEFRHRLLEESSVPDNWVLLGSGILVALATGLVIRLDKQKAK